MDAAAFIQHGVVSITKRLSEPRFRMVPRFCILVHHGPPTVIYLRRGLSGLAGLGTTELLGRGVLLGLLRTADSAHTSDSLLAEISAVAILGRLVGNTLVDPAKSHSVDQYHLFLSNVMLYRADIRTSRDSLLAGGGAGTVGHRNLVLAGLLGVAGLLGGNGNGTVLIALDTDGLGERLC